MCPWPIYCTSALIVLSHNDLEFGALTILYYNRAVNGYPGDSTTRVMKMLPGYPFKALNNSILHLINGYPGIGKRVPGWQNVYP